MYVAALVMMGLYFLVAVLVPTLGFLCQKQLNTLFGVRDEKR